MAPRSSIRPVGLRTELADRLLPDESRAERLRAFHLVGPDGRHWKGPDAIPPLLERVRLRPAASLLRRSPLAFRTTARAYEWVTRNRGRLGRFVPRSHAPGAEREVGRPHALGSTDQSDRIFEGTVPGQPATSGPSHPWPNPSASAANALRGGPPGAGRGGRGSRRDGVGQAPGHHLHRPRPIPRTDPIACLGAGMGQVRRGDVRSRLAGQAGPPVEESMMKRGEAGSPRPLPKTQLRARSGGARTDAALDLGAFVVRPPGI